MRENKSDGKSNQITFVQKQQPQNKKQTKKQWTFQEVINA